MTRAKAADWGIDPKRVGVWGFSAGGHLASTVATVFDAGNAESADPVERMSSRPDFAILFYPVVNMNGEIAHKGSRRNLMGSEDLGERYSSELRVTSEAPPCFLLHCTDDTTVIKVETSVARRPPRRSRRAELPHRAPQECAQVELRS